MRESLAYVGHAERWDKAEIDGQLDADTRNCTITYCRGGRQVHPAYSSYPDRTKHR